jgi:hypothetical protein
MDELHEIFTAYEMIIEHENPDIKEASFKASKRSKQKGKKKEKEHSSSSDILADDEEATNFVKRLNKGTNDRYRGNIPLICFNCDGIGHFAKKILIRKREMMNITQIENKYIKEKEPQRKFSRKSCAHKKTSHHQMNMNSVTVRHKEFYSWK